MTEPTPDDELDALVDAIPEGWSRQRIHGEPWGVTRTTRAGGKVISVEAEHLGTSEQLGANVWITTNGAILRPCEIPADTVMGFLRAAAQATES